MGCSAPSGRGAARPDPLALCGVQGGRVPVPLVRQSCTPQLLHREESDLRRWQVVRIQPGEQAQAPRPVAQAHRPGSLVLAWRGRLSGRLGGRGRETAYAQAHHCLRHLTGPDTAAGPGQCRQCGQSVIGSRSRGPPGRQQPSAAAAPNDAFVINDGFVTKTYNHLGNPANGILTAETWGETGWINTEPGGLVPNNSQGVVRALKQSKVLRVAVRVELWGWDVPEPGIPRLLASSSTVNSGTAASVQVKTPEVNVGSAPCLLWTKAFVTIRWSDNRLSSVSFEMPIGYFNLDAHC